MNSNGINYTDEVIQLVVDALGNKIDTLIDNLGTRVELDLKQENLWRKSAISKVDLKINLVADKLQQNISSENNHVLEVKSDLLSLIESLDSKLLSNDNALQNNIDLVSDSLTQSDVELLNNIDCIAKWSKSISSPKIEHVDRVNSLLGLEISARESSLQSISKSLNNEIVRALVVEGSLNNLYTSDKSSLVGAINSNSYKINSVESEIKRLIKDETDNRTKQLNSNVKLNSDDIQNIYSDLDVIGNINVHETLTTNNQVINGDVNINGNQLSINGKTVLNDTLAVYDDTLIQGNVYVLGKNGESRDVLVNGNVKALSLTVEGNLNVKGLTITQLEKTLEVDDNLIVTRSNATEQPISPTGVVINLSSEFDSDGQRLKNNSVGVVYNPNTLQVELCRGLILSTGDIDVQSGLPIVVSDNSINIKDGNLTAWSKNIVSTDDNSYVLLKVIDSGVSLSDYVEGKDLLTATVSKLNELDLFVKYNVDDLNSQINNEQYQRANDDGRITNFITSELARAQQEENSIRLLLNDSTNQLHSLVGHVVSDLDGNTVSLQELIHKINSDVISINDSICSVNNSIEKEKSDRLLDIEHAKLDVIDRISNLNNDLNSNKENLLSLINNLITSVEDQQEEIITLNTQLLENSELINETITSVKNELITIVDKNKQLLDNEIVIRKRNDADIQVSMNDIVKDIHDKYAPMMEFYSSFVQASIEYSDKPLCVSFDLVSKKPIWKPVETVANTHEQE